MLLVSSSNRFVKSRVHFCLAKHIFMRKRLFRPLQDSTWLKKTHYGSRRTSIQAGFPVKDSWRNLHSKWQGYVGQVADHTASNGFLKGHPSGKAIQMVHQTQRFSLKTHRWSTPASRCTGNFLEESTVQVAQHNQRSSRRTFRWSTTSLRHPYTTHERWPIQVVEHV